MGGLEGAKEDHKKTGVDRCVQRGSHVDDERLRFDVAWDAPLTQEQLSQVEKICADIVDNALQSMRWRRRWTRPWTSKVCGP